MITRRDILKGGLATLTVPYIGRGEPRRSMLGAVDTGEEGSGEWVNPYVTDGLVAMWDGQWNAGGGIHVSETMEWYDVCGNEPSLVPYDGLTPLLFGDKALITTSVVPWNESSGRLFNQYATLYTIECGFENVRCNYNYPSFYNGRKGSTNGTMFRGMKWGQDSGTNTQIQVILSNTSTSMQSTISNNERLTLSLTFDGIGRAYKNGLFDIQAEQTGRNVNTLLMVGGGPNGTCFREFYFLRIYSRCLTAAEIAENYSVDKVRFNLQ